MPTINTEGKDTIIFVTKEDHASPSKIELPEPEQSPGLILPDGEINWNCPCLGGMATGPCGLEFREAFSCFHYSNADPKGANCREPFNAMHTCMSQYPSLYGNKDTDMDDMDLNDERPEISMVEKNSVEKSSTDDKTDQENTPSNNEQVKRISSSK